MWNRKATSETGQALILGVLLMAVVLALTGMVTDVGLAYLEKAKLQRAADAAALAGVDFLPEDANEARAAAQQIAVANGIDPTRLQIEVSTTSHQDDTITVHAQSGTEAYFTRVLGFIGFGVGVKAASRAGSPAGVNEFLPLAVEQSVFRTMRTGDKATLKYDSLNQITGNSLALALPGNSGADDFRRDIAQGSEGALCIAGQEYSGCTSIVSTEPGQMTGPLRQGMLDRFSQTITACDTFSEVVSTDPTNSNDYIVDRDCQPFHPYNVDGSRRIAIVPVIDHLCNGSCYVRVVQFALFFIDDISCTNNNNGGKQNQNSQGQGTCTVTGEYAERVTNVNKYVKLGAYDSDAAFAIGALTE